MLAKIKALLKAAIRPQTALKGIASIDPKMRSFMVSAAAAGYGADQVMSFLRNAVTGKPAAARQQDVRERTASGMARPEEMAEGADLGIADRVQGMASAAAGGLAGLAGLAGGSVGTTEAEPGPEVSGPEQQQRQQPNGFRDDYPFDRRQIGSDDQRLLEQQQQETGNQQQPPEQREPPQLGGPAPTLLLEQQQRQSGTGGYVKKALDGVEYFDLPDEAREPIAPLVKALFNLEQNKTPWKDKSVQRLVKGIRKRVGFVDREAARAGMDVQQQVAPQAPQGPTIDQKFQEFLKNFSQRFMGE